jgi:hypothetical protein
MSASSRSLPNKTVFLSPREEQERAGWVTTDENLKEHLEASARQRGLVYCDLCGMWFASSCLCDDFRREEDL